jgi:DNA-binding LacI/PurR family transcriptional regulator
LHIFDILNESGINQVAYDENCLPYGKSRSFWKSQGVNFKQEQILTPRYDISNIFERGMAMAEDFLSAGLNTFVKVVLIHDDKMATGFISGLMREGIEIPNEIGVIGFDNLDSAPYFRLPLTTVDFPLRHHVDVALSKILDGKSIERITETVPRVEYRESLPSSLIK